MRLKQFLTKQNRGFTLVELIVVVAIISVLTAMLAPRYILYVENSRVVTDEVYIRQVARGLEVLSAANNDVYSTPVTVTFDAVGKIQGSSATGSNAAATEAAVDAGLAELFPEAEQRFKSDYYKGTGAEHSSGVTLVLDARGTVTISGTKNINTN